MVVGWETKESQCKEYIQHVVGLRPQPKSAHDTECVKTLAHRSICECISPTLSCIYTAQTHICTHTTIHFTYIHKDIFTQYIGTYIHIHTYAYIYIHTCTTFTHIYIHICRCLVCDRWSQIHCTAKEDDLELLILPPLKCSDYRCTCTQHEHLSLLNSPRGCGYKWFQKGVTFHFTTLLTQVSLEKNTNFIWWDQRGETQCVKRLPSGHELPEFRSLTLI